ncbi:MAG TPA: glutathione peroxidase [Oligoflexia bacterium]|nr:glutathione peroxidase [Oligoflexia bacterium]
MIKISKATRYLLLTIGILGFLPACHKIIWQNTPLKNLSSDSLAANIFQFNAARIDGTPFHFSELRGKVLLIVNTASKCGFAPQLLALEELYQRYKERGFVVLIFPSADFGNLEFDSPNEIQSNLTDRFGVTFPILNQSKISGKEKDPIFKFLTESGGRPLKGEISWNYEKFLIDKNGKLRARFGSFTLPLSDKIVSNVEKLLHED